MSKHKKHNKIKKSRIDWNTLIIAAILDFIVSLIMLILSKLLD